MKRVPLAPILPSDISTENVFFTFPSGSLAYDCQWCNSWCCRGHGYLLNKAVEAPMHLQSRPNLHVFLNHEGNDSSKSSLEVINCPPGCFFLSTDGLCGIQKDHDLAAKPEACRLFPFNRIRRIGGYLLVSPHPSLCPLEFTPMGAFSDESGHEFLLAEMQRSGISAQVPLCDGPHGLSIEDALGLERAIRDEAQRYAGVTDYESYASAQLAMTESLVSFDRHCEALSQTRAAERMRAFGRLVLRLLGITLSSAQLADSNMSRSMAISTPTLRSDVVFTAQKAQDGAFVATDLDRVPYVMFGIYLLAVTAWGAGMSAITFQTLSGLARRYSALLSLLSEANRVMVLKPGVPIPLEAADGEDFQSRYLRVTKALLPRQQQRSERTLGDILEEHCTFHGSDRMRFLVLVARRFRGILLPINAYTSQHLSVAKRVRCAVQRSALGLVNEEALIRFLARRAV